MKDVIDIRKKLTENSIKVSKTTLIEVRLLNSPIGQCISFSLFSINALSYSSLVKTK